DDVTGDHVTLIIDDVGELGVETDHGTAGPRRHRRHRHVVTQSGTSGATFASRGRVRGRHRGSISGGISGRARGGRRGVLTVTVVTLGPIRDNDRGRLRGV